MASRHSSPQLMCAGSGTDLVMVSGRERRRTYSGSCPKQGPEGCFAGMAGTAACSCPRPRINARSSPRACHVDVAELCTAGARIASDSARCRPGSFGSTPAQSRPAAARGRARRSRRVGRIDTLGGRGGGWCARAATLWPPGAAARAAGGAAIYRAGWWVREGVRAALSNNGIPCL